MKINDMINGFRITKIQQMKSGELVTMSHEKTAARLVWMNNHEENKLFSISFKTIPWDDTGVFHILEHSVLGGSEKYPVKEPFLYLLKGSMNTFLNAMTFPDKTMFPVASRNSRDFMNLTEVYLDAVFKPAIYTEPNIFCQEGHHIEWDGESEPLYKGVVFNEMKGCVSSVDERIESGIMDMLFPDSCYRFEYGGYPASIPELTYEQFIEAHKRFYHPSNSYIYLDGDVDINAVLALIDSYLAEYDRSTELPVISMQPAVETCTKESVYAAAPDDDTENMTYLTLGKVIADWSDIVRITAYIVLTEALAGSNDAPFTRAMLDTGMCLAVEMNVSDGIQQPFVMLKICNIKRSDGEPLLEKIRTTARSLVENGIGRELLVSAINRCEFRFCEPEEPKGLTRNIDAMSSWLYGGDPADYIGYSGVFETLRQKADTRFYEELLADFLLSDSGLAILYMNPSVTLSEEESAAEAERVRAAVESLSAEKKAELVEMNRALAEWQAAPDSDEAVAALPVLPLSEVDPEPMAFVTEKVSDHGIDVLRHPTKDPEIVAIRLYFNAADLTPDELKTLSLMDRLIAELQTEHSTGIELQQKITGILGSLTTAVTAYGKADSPEECRVFFTVTSRFLDRNFDAALRLIGEILTETVYDNTALADELLRQDEEDMRQDIIAAGHSFSLRRARSAKSAESAVNELMDGFEGYKYLQEVNRGGSARLIEEIKAIAAKVICRERLTASITSAAEHSFGALADMLPHGEKAASDTMRMTLDIPKKQAIVIPSGVSYSGAVLAERVDDKAVWNVLTSALTYEYLWNEVRVKGGAYGTGSTNIPTGLVSFHSYRDPSPEASVATYERAGDFLRGYCEGGTDISRYIISTIASSEPLLSVGAYNNTADAMYFRGITQEERRKVRRDMLDLTAEKLLTALPKLGKLENICIIGSKEAVEPLKNKGFAIEKIS